MDKERMRAIAATVAAMSEEQRAEIAARLPVVTIEGHVISGRNVCLISAQTDAPVTVIGGFKQWLARGRCVRKGERAFYILRPCQRGARAGAEPTPAPEDGAEEGGSMYFVPVPMFDVSQTDELPEDRRPRARLAEPEEVAA